MGNGKQRSREDVGVDVADTTGVVSKELTFGRGIWCLCRAQSRCQGRTWQVQALGFEPRPTEYILGALPIELPSQGKSI